MNHLDMRLHLFRGEQKFYVEAIVPNGITVISGPSGAGKTTLLRCIAGLEPKVQGRIQLEEKIWQNQKKNIPSHKRGIGFCFQNSRVLPHLTVRGNLQYIKWIKCIQGKRRATAFEIDELLQRLEMFEISHRSGHNLSGGEARRVALARALLSASNLLLLDEPFVGLEQEMRQIVLDLITDFHTNTHIPVLIATHDLEHTRKICDYTLLMKMGRCISFKEANTLYTPPVLEKSI